MTTTVHPENVYALVVGVETYEIDEDYNLDGPARDGLQFIEWLLSQNVPAKNINFFISYLPQNKDVYECAKKRDITCAPATHKEIEEYINSNLIANEAKGELLYVFWGGHGVINTTDQVKRQLYFSDFTKATIRSLAIETLIEALRTDQYGQVYSKQIYFIDACASIDYSFGSPEAWRSAASALKIPPSGDGDACRVREQHVFFAAAKNETTPNDSLQSGGIFSRLVLNELEKQASLWPDPDAIWLLLKNDNRLEEEYVLYQRPGFTDERDRKLSEKYPVTDTDLPLPNAGHSQKPKSQRAFFLNPSDTFQGNPLEKVKFNLEIFLGLERKTFTAIIFGFEGDGLFSSFRAIEYELQAAVELSHDYKLPTRWWVRLEINELTALPRREADVWNLIVDEDAISKYLTLNGLPEAVVPGIFISIDIQVLGPALLLNLRDWITAVIGTIFSLHSVAIVIDLQCHSGLSIAEILQQAENINNSLATSPKISADAVLRIMLAEACDRLQQPQKVVRSTFPAPTRNDTEGYYIYLWILKALEKNQIDIRYALIRYTEILHIYEKFSHNFVEPASISIPLRQLIYDLDIYAKLLNGAENRSLYLYRNLLEFTQQYNSSNLHELLTAYAYSQTTEAYRQALSFACSHSTVYSDILIDVFLDGTIDRSAQISFTQSLEFNNSEWLEPTQEYFVDKLGLAFLRRMDNNNYFQVLAEKIQSRLSSKAAIIASFRLGQCSKKELVERMERDTQLLTYLISSITNVNPIIDFLQSSQYRRREPYIWALSICLQQYTECFETMLKSDKAFSMLWGLCMQELPGYDKEERENFLKHWRNYLAT